MHRKSPAGRPETSRDALQGEGGAGSGIRRPLYKAFRALCITTTLVMAATSCRSERRSATYPQGGSYSNPGQYSSGGYPPGSAPAPQYSPSQPQYPPNQPLPPSGQPPQGTAPGLPPVSLPVLNDPVNGIEIQALRNIAGEVMGTLINALAPAPQARVRDIPFVADPTVGEVNAFAACDEQGLPLMAISDGLLEVEAHIAQFKATDELFGTRKVDQYVQLLAQNQRPNQPLARPGPGFVDPIQHVDGRKVARQRQIFEEQLAFVLGHELGHHHLGHTGCANGQGGSRGVNPSDLGRVLSRALPIFNQPNEMAADVAGVNNLLTAGSRRPAYKWTETGAMLTLSFFASLDQLTPATIVFGFERTHPHPLLRQPIVQSTANTWRMTGGNVLTIPGLFGG